MHCKGFLEKQCLSTQNRFKFGDVSSGYMDYSYFPFYNDYLRKLQLHFGLMLNHFTLHFKLWLIGQNATVQAKYWNLLKHTKWNTGIKQMPTYSALQQPLVNYLDHLDATTLFKQLTLHLSEQTTAILSYLKTTENA